MTGMDPACCHGSKRTSCSSFYVFHGMLTRLILHHFTPRHIVIETEISQILSRRQKSIHQTFHMVRKRVSFTVVAGVEKKTRSAHNSLKVALTIFEVYSAFFLVKKIMQLLVYVLHRFTLYPFFSN